MERELRAYRANPTDARFAEVYRLARPWLTTVSETTVRRYTTALSISGSAEDVAVEGAVAISAAARRFVYLCEDCGRAFVHVSDLGAHQRKEHRRRGACALVSLKKFALTSARLAMKRTARRLVRSSECLVPAPEEVDLDVEERIVFGMMLDRVRGRLTARTLEALEALLRGASIEGPLPVEAELGLIRAEVQDILHLG